MRAVVRWVRARLAREWSEIPPEYNWVLLDTQGNLVADPDGAFYADPDGLEGEVCVGNPDAQPGVVNPPGTPARRYHPEG